MYIQVDCLTPERLGLAIGRVGDGDDVATGVKGLLSGPGLVRAVECLGNGDDVASVFNAVNLVIIGSLSSYVIDILNS